ncbi:MAG: type II secretion system secretin GspD [Thermodesulfobacteriota bacterium]
MRRLLVLLLALNLALLALSPAASLPAHAQPAQQMTANLDNIGIKDFLKFVANYTGRNIVFREDQVPNIAVSFFSKEAITEPELMAILRHMLRNNGLELIGKGDILYVQPVNQINNIEDTVYPKLGAGAGDELLTTVYQLPPDVPASKVGPLLQGFATPTLGKVTPVPEARAVIIRDKRARVNEMIEVLKEFRNIRPRWDLEVFRMERIKAEEALSMVKEFFTQLVDRGQEGEVPLAQAVKWSNSLLVAGAPEQLDTVRDLLARLAPGEDAANKYKIYKLQNAKASSVYTVLQALGGRMAQQQQQQQGGAPAKAPAGAAAAVSAAASANDLFSLSMDPSTNTIVVMSDPEFLSQVDDIVARLDQPQDQVFVEALIMETSLNNVENFGIEWLAGVGDKNIAGNIGFTDSSSNLLSYQKPVVDDTGPPNFGALAGGFSMGALGNVITYSGHRFPTLSALASFIKTAQGVNILSTPQILTLDNSEAEIFIGSERAFLTGTKSDTSTDTAIVNTYEYKEVGIKLQVTPHINQRDGLIRLELEQEVKDVVDASAATLTPTTNTRTAKTSVQLVDGATMVIGGLVQDDVTRGQRSVPGLRDIPLLGWFFKKQNANADKRTLMFFISARIVHTIEDLKRLGQDKLEEAQRTSRNVQEAIDREFGVEPEEKPGEAPPAAVPSPAPGSGESIAPPVPATPPAEVIPPRPLEN